MKNKVKLVSTVLAASLLLAASAGALVVTGLTGEVKAAAEEENAEKERESLYLVMDVDGNIGVYYRQSLLYRTDISVYGLPESVQRQLREGVSADTYGQVLSLLEDYSS